MVIYPEKLIWLDFSAESIYITEFITKYLTE
jgi:hypothetical protein